MDKHTLDPFEQDIEDNYESFVSAENAAEIMKQAKIGAQEFFSKKEEIRNF